MNTILLVTILAINIIWFIIWFYRKTQTITYKAIRFIQKEKVKLPFGAKGMATHEEVLVQLFLRHGNEDLREEMKSEYKRVILVDVFDKHLTKVEDRYLINPKAKFITRDAPTPPPIDDDDLQEL